MHSVNGPTGPRPPLASTTVKQQPQPARAQFAALLQQPARAPVGQGLGSGVSGSSVIASALGGRSPAALQPYAYAFGAVAPESSGDQAPAAPGAGTPTAPNAQQRAMMDLIMKMAISVMVNSVQAGFSVMSNQPKPELELEKG